MQLVTADRLSLRSFSAMLEDYSKSGKPFLGMTDPSSFSSFVRICVQHSLGIGLAVDVSPYTRYFLVDDAGTVYAQGDVRHKATKRNVTFAGQLGYGVLPSFRGHGYGTLMCALLLEKAKEKGFDEVIITCRDDNRGSARIIEKNGGRLLETRFSFADRTLMRRYTVKTVPNVTKE